MGLLKTFVFIVGVYYLLKFIGRLLLPIMAKKVVEKAQANMNERMRQYSEQQQAAQNTVRTDGDISVQRKPKRKTQDDDSEYVQFEEVKE